MPEIIAGLFGLLIGSFLNVCIYRWPRDLSVVAPRSRCPGCERTIAWYDNIPVLSYVLLWGRCRHCSQRISARYPLVEALTAAAFICAVAQHGLTLEAAKYCVLAAIVIALIFSDLDTRILPDELTIGGCIIGIAFSFFVAIPDSTFAILASLAGFTLNARASSAGESLLGALVPAFGLWLIGWLFEKLRHKEGLGFGDVKMIAAIGAFLGIRGTLFSLVVGSVLGSVTGLIWIAVTRKDAGTYQLPLGTFLGIGALAATYWT
ncbi:MAG TPA: prepilin peptidase [Bryobacteraceae bacterium]|nr:prepilin peptidase [Bryobacteraceae bacterium]